MSTRTALIVCVMVCVHPLVAQLDLLTLRESELILEKVPALKDAFGSRECPILSPSYADSQHFLIQARVGCGPKQGMLIENYFVDRRNGSVTTAGESPVSVSGPESDVLARKLVAGARKRLISSDEARCLAMEAAKALPGWLPVDESISLEQLGKPAKGRAEFTAWLRSTIHPIEVGRALTVDLTSGRVRDDETGLDVSSGGLGALTAEVIALRDSRLLTDEDAVLIALQVPSLAGWLRDGCRLSVSGALRAEEALVGVACDGHLAADAPTFAVNLITGELTDVMGGKITESPNAAKVVEERFQALEERQSVIQRKIQDACKAPDK